MNTLKWVKPYASNFPNFQHLEDERRRILSSIDYSRGVWYVRHPFNWVAYPDIKTADEARAMAEVLYRMGG